MAFFGDFKDFLFEDIVTIASQKDGTLRIVGVCGFDSLELNLFKGNICDFRLNNVENLDSTYLRSAFKNTISSRQGSFEFIQLSPDLFHKRLQLPVMSYMLNATRALDELEDCYEALPSVETKYILSQDNIGSLKFSGDDQAYFELTAADLRQGASAGQLNKNHGIPSVYLRYYLYRWNMAGIIEPMRSFSQTWSRVPSAENRPITVPLPPFDTTPSTSPTITSRQSHSALDTGINYDEIVEGLTYLEN